jgi:hypothetical protein
MARRSVNAEIEKAVECLRYAFSTATLNLVQCLFILSTPARAA